MRICRKCNSLYRVGDVLRNKIDRYDIGENCDVCPKCKNQLNEYAVSRFVVNDVSEFLKILRQLYVFEIDTTSPISSLFSVQGKVDLVFRGQSSVNYSLLPSLVRRKESKLKLMGRYEWSIIKEVTDEFPKEFLCHEDILELLVALQHYGVPTRLLDVTKNPLVALYFACLSNSYEEKENGEVVVFGRKYSEFVYSDQNLALLRGLADINSWENTEGVFLENFLKRYEIEWEPADLPHIYNYTNNVVKFIYVPRKHVRQRVQFGGHILFCNQLGLFGDPENIQSYAFVPQIGEIKKNNEFILARIEISRESKKEILSELEHVGISKATLFPEDISIRCKEIAQKYGYN